MNGAHTILAIQEFTVASTWQVILDLTERLGVSALVGVLLGTWLNRWAARETIVHERRVEAIAEFLGHAEPRFR